MASNSDGQEPPKGGVSTDDDGWGDASELEKPAPDVAVEEDPTNLDEKVARLHRETGTHLVPAQPAAPQAGGEAPASTVPASNDDAPQWEPEPVDLPPPSSDMLAAAGIHKTSTSSDDQPVASERSRLTTKQLAFLIGAGVLMVIIAAIAIAGWFNHQNYYLVCGTDAIRAQQGDFWPWGQSDLEGERFRPIPVPGEVLCEDIHFGSEEELEEAFLAALLDRTTAMLTSGDAETVDRAEKQIEQLFLLTRTEEHRAQRQKAQRLQGDVSYWRGYAAVEQAKKLLLESAKQFEDAATRRPRHSTDAHTWSKYARKIGEELGAGPSELRDKPESRPTYEPVESPIHEGQSPIEEPKTPAGSDAGTAFPATAPPADASPPPPPDAGLPKGGVLL
jgi:hypothetical protein